MRTKMLWGVLFWGLALANCAELPGQEFSTASDVSPSREELFREVAAEAELFQRQGNLVKKVVQLVKPSVVHVEAKKFDEGPEGDRSVEEAGSGIIFEHEEAFYVLTNWHVIRNSPQSEITIHLADGEKLHPLRIKRDPPTDVAVMEIRSQGLVPARLGDSSGLEIGDFVLAYGSPFGLSHSVTFGMVSAKGRRDLKLGNEVQLQDFIQTDAAINPGNSGGPLVNLRGEVVGLNTAIASSSGGSEGIGFAIPINIALHAAVGLIDGHVDSAGAVIRPQLGVVLDTTFDQPAARRLGLDRLEGASIKKVNPNTAAEAAGIRAGDVILEFDRIPIADDDHLTNQVKLTPPGRDIEIIVLREGTRVSLTARLRRPRKP